MKNLTKHCQCVAVIAALVAMILSSQPASATLLSYMPFDGGTVGQTLNDTTASGGGAIGFTSTFSSITNPGNGTYVAGLSGSQGGSGNAFRAGPNGHRHRMIIDRTTTEYQNSGLLTGVDDLLGANGTSVFGSVLIANPSGAPLGFTGLEFAIGNPNANRKITLGEAAGSGDWVVIGAGAAASSASATNLALPAASSATREIVFRIDFGAGNADTFTLINPDGTDGATSATSNLEFSTLHLASFGGDPGVVYDEIKLGTTLADVTNVIPEPASMALGMLGLALMVFGRQRK